MCSAWFRVDRCRGCAQSAGSALEFPFFQLKERSEVDRCTFVAETWESCEQCLRELIAKTDDLSEQFVALFDCRLRSGLSIKPGSYALEGSQLVSNQLHCLSAPRPRFLDRLHLRFEGHCCLGGESLQPQINSTQRGSLLSLKLRSKPLEDTFHCRVQGRALFGKLLQQLRGLKPHIGGYLCLFHRRNRLFKLVACSRELSFQLRKGQHRVHQMRAEQPALVADLLSAGLNAHSIGRLVVHRTFRPLGQHRNSLRGEQLALSRALLVILRRDPFRPERAILVCFHFISRAGLRAAR